MLFSDQRCFEAGIFVADVLTDSSGSASSTPNEFFFNSEAFPRKKLVLGGHNLFPSHKFFSSACTPALIMCGLQCRPVLKNLLYSTRLSSCWLPQPEHQFLFAKFNFVVHSSPEKGRSCS